MGTLAVTLILASTVLHATWNLLAKRIGGAQAYIGRLQLAVVLIGAAPAAWSLIGAPFMTWPAVACVIGSGISCGFYFVCLARSYESGDFTTVYPAARALPVVLVALGDVVRGHAPTPVGWVGLTLVAAGCLLVPLRSFADLHLGHYLRPANLWILLTALGTASYSLIDKIGTDHIPQGPRETATYCYIYFLVTAAAYVPLRRWLAPRTRDTTKVGWRIPVFAGLCCYGAYWLVLMSYQLTDQAGYVVAFRQFSIVIGVVASFVVLSEPGKMIRLLASLVIVTGLVLVKFSGE